MLSLSGYLDCQIQKMGLWQGETLKEYIREELADFTVGMLRDMKTCFNFVSVAGGAYHNVTGVAVETEYGAGVKVIVPPVMESQLAYGFPVCPSSGAHGHMIWTVTREASEHRAAATARRITS